MPPSAIVLPLPRSLRGLTRVAASRLPIVSTAASAFRDWRRLFSVLRGLMFSAFLVLLVISAATEFIPNRIWQQELFGDALTLVQDAAEALLLAPLIIAIHRFVILGEATRSYLLDLGDPTFRLFVGWLFALKIIGGLPFTLLGALQALGWQPLATVLPFAVALVLALIISIRFTILFPALAVRAAGASAAHALADSKGYVLRILAIFCIVLLPWLLLDIVIVLLLGPGAHVGGSSPAMLTLAFSAVLQTGMVSISAVAVSHMFQALASEVRRRRALQQA